MTLIDENGNGEIISGHKYIAQKVNNYFSKICNTYGEFFSVSFAFEYYMNSANVGEPFKLSN